MVRSLTTIRRLQKKKNLMTQLYKKKLFKITKVLFTTSIVLAGILLTVVIEQGI